MGIDWPVPRFIDNGDDTVTDQMTGLMWTTSADLFASNWFNALVWCNELVFAEYDDWRLPNIKELLSIVDFSGSGILLPSDHPFLSVRANYYWSSTTDSVLIEKAWTMHMGTTGYGASSGADKTSGRYVWAVRGGGR